MLSLLVETIWRTNRFICEEDCFASMITFHKATRDDASGLLEVMRDTNYVQFLKEPYEESIRSFVDVDLVYVAKDGEKIIAYAIFTYDLDRIKEAPITLEKDFIASGGVGVHSSYRKQGIAMKLKDHAHEQLNQVGIKGIYTDVGDNNEASLRLQEKLGFKLLVKYDSKHRPAGVKNCVFAKEL